MILNHVLHQILVQALDKGIPLIETSPPPLSHLHCLQRYHPGDTEPVLLHCKMDNLDESAYHSEGDSHLVSNKFI